VNGPRRQAREAALGILYFWEVGRTDADAAIDAYFQEHAEAATDDIRGFAEKLVLGTVGELLVLDRFIEEHSKNWRLERMAIVDRLVLRMAIWELRHEPETPAAVVLNEALELTRRFSSPDAVKFVNGVLDGVHHALEAERTAARDTAN
jgi:N utilization substance protein B